MNHDNCSATGAAGPGALSSSQSSPAISGRGTPVSLWKGGEGEGKVGSSGNGSGG